MGVLIAHLQELHSLHISFFWWILSDVTYLMSSHFFLSFILYFCPIVSFTFLHNHVWKTFILQEKLLKNTKIWCNWLLFPVNRLETIQMKTQTCLHVQLVNKQTHVFVLHMCRSCTTYMCLFVHFDCVQHIWCLPISFPFFCKITREKTSILLLSSIFFLEIWFNWMLFLVNWKCKWKHKNVFTESKICTIYVCTFNIKTNKTTDKKYNFNDIWRSCTHFMQMFCILSLTFT